MCVTLVIYQQSLWEYRVAKHPLTLRDLYQLSILYNSLICLLIHSKIFRRSEIQN